MESTENTEKQTSSIKLIKMSKGYNWEIKVYNDDLNIAKTRIEELDNFFRAKWGNNDARE